MKRLYNGKKYRDALRKLQADYLLACLDTDEIPELIVGLNLKGRSSREHVSDLLKGYGTVLRAEPYSSIIGFKPYDASKLRSLANDYKNGSLDDYISSISCNGAAALIE